MAGPEARLRVLLEALLVALMAAAVAGLAAGGRLGLAVGGAAGTALALRALLLGREAALRRLPAGWEWMAAIGCLPFFAADILLLRSGWPVVLLHVVLAFGLIKLYTARGPRDYMLLRLVAAMLLMGAAMSAPPLVFLLCLAVAVPATVASFVLQEVLGSHRLAEAAATAQPVILQRRAGALGGSLFGFALGLSGAVAVFAAAIFLLLPRTSMGSAAPAGAEALTGFSDTVVLGTIGALQQSDATVMHIRISDTQPPMAPTAVARLLWRGRALSDFDGKSWTASDRPRFYRTQYGQKVFENRPYPGTVSQLLRYQVTLEPLATPVLFYPARLLETWTRYNLLSYDAVSGTVGSGNNGGFAATTYSGISDTGLPPVEALRAAPPFRESTRFGELPPDLDPRIKELALRVTMHDRNDWDRMQGLSDYLSGEYGYTLENLPMGSDPLADFLFDHKAGNCEYFASALAIMGRTLQIPTRVVTGFLLGPYNPISGEYIVAARQAHSWVEAYFPAPDGGPGIWVPFDATPSVTAGTGDSDSRAAFLLDAMGSVWQEWVVGYDWMHQAALAHNTLHGLRDNAATVGANGRSWMRSALAWLAGGGLARTATDRATAWRAVQWTGGIALGVLALLLGLGWRRRRPPAKPAAVPAWSAMQARRMYRQFQRALRRQGTVRRPAETAEELLARVPARLREPAAAFVGTYQKLRFSPAGAAEAGALVEAAERQLAALKTGERAPA